MLTSEEWHANTRVKNVYAKYVVHRVKTGELSDRLWIEEVKVGTILTKKYVID